jgi:hypothetical protein
VRRHDARAKFLVDVTVIAVLVAAMIALFFWRGRDWLAAWLR